MGKSIIFWAVLAGTVTFGFSGTSFEDEESELIFSPSVRIIAKSKLGIVVRGEMKSLSARAALIVPDRSRFRFPNGVEYKLEKLQMLSIQDADLKWVEGEDTGEFLTKVSKQEGMPISNIVQFQQAELAKSGLNSPPGETVSGTEPGKKIMMKPASTTDPLKPQVTVTCGNCFKEVPLSSESGQKCPFCGILWDNSPAEKPAMTLEQPPRSHPNPGGQQPQPVVAPQQNVPGGQPVTVPQPTQYQPQEMTLGNLPIWLKAAVFCAFMGISYYVVFVR